MTITFIPLEESDPDGHRHVGRNIRGRYLDGECYEFALALSEGLGWPIVGIITNDKKNTVRHVALLTPMGTYFDARGFVSVDELTQPFDLDEEEFFLRPSLVRADLEAVRSISGHSIGLARKLAEAYWPDLPWKDCLEHRTRLFLSDLEDLSRQHGIWVFGYLPTTLPGLSESDGEDEAGYTAVVNSTGLNVRFNRRLNNE